MDALVSHGHWTSESGIKVLVDIGVGKHALAAVMLKLMESSPPEVYSNSPMLTQEPFVSS